MKAYQDSPNLKEKSGKKKHTHPIKTFKALQSLQQTSQMRTLNSPQKRKVTSLHKLEELANNMSLISNMFLATHPNQKKVKLFIQTFENWLNGTYLDVLLILRQFSDFNLFDFIDIQCAYHNKMTQKEIAQRTKMIIIRNNIALSVLVIAKEIEFCEKNGEIDFNQKEPLFADLRFLNPLVEKFKTLLLETDSHFTISIDVELFFLAILDYKDKARIIKQKFSQYFKELVIDCNIPKYNFDYFLTLAVDKHSFSDYNTEELILLRRIFRNAAMRNFYFGIEYLLKTVDYSFILSEGRIWKSIGMKMQPFNVYNLWMLYEEKIDDIRETDLRETLTLEYEEKITSLNKQLNSFSKENQISEEYNKLLYQKRILEKEILLFNVTCLKEVLVIFFKSDLKELVLYFFEEYLSSNENQKIPLEIFELCIDYDEDIAIDIVDKSLTSSTVEKYHMEMALIKKYFRLARKLMKYPQCLNLLSLTPPNSDDYIVCVSKLQVNQKKRLFEKIQYQNENDDLKIIDYIQETSSLNTSMDHNHVIAVNSKEAKEKEDSIIGRISKEKIQVDLKATSTFFEKKKQYLASMNQEEQDSSKVNFLNLKENAALMKSLNPKEAVINNAFQEQNRKGIYPRPSLEVTYDPELKPEVMVIKQGSFSIEHNNYKSLNDNHLGPKNNEGLSPITSQPFKVNPSKRYSFNKRYNNEMDPYTPTSKLSVLSSSPLIDSNPNISQQQYLAQFKKSKTEDLKIDIIKKGKLKINVQMLLIDQLRFGQYAFDALCLLSSIQTRAINPDYAEKICSYLLVFTTNEDAITKCSEPLLLVALAAELLIKISKINQKVKYKAETVAMEILILGEKLQSSIKDEDMLNYYLKEQCDDKGRSALEVYAENRFFNLLSDLNVGSIVGKLWFGSGHEQSIYKFLRMTRILTANITKERYESIINNDYLPKNASYSFQFYQYINNCSIRFFFESFSVVAITILYQFIIYTYVTFTKEENELHPPSHYYYMTNLVANGLMCCSLLNYVILLLYYYKTGRKLKINNTELVINIILLVAILLNFINLPQRLFPVETNIDINILFDGAILSVILVMAWMKVIVILMSTNTYGPFLRIMFTIFWHVFAFLLIVFCITFIFAQCFTLFFGHSNKDFEFFYVGFIALFNTAFGQCNFGNFVDLQIFGYVALIAYTTLSNIMLFNLIVAIINNLFNGLENKAEAENRAVLVLTYERLKWDERYGLFILLPTPLNAISLLFIPVLILCRDSATYFNLIFSKICYFFVAVIVFIFISLVGAISYPFALVKSLLHSSYDTMMITGYKKIGIIALSFASRPFILLGYFGEDLYLFWSMLYQEPASNLTQDDTAQYIRKYILALRKVLNEARYKEKKKVLPLNELYTKLCLFKKKTKDTLASSISKIERVSSSSSTYSKKSKERDYSINSNNRKEKTSSNSVLSLINDEGKNRLQEEMKSYFRQIIDKVVDPEGFVDIERTLLILPDRVKYCDSFVKNIENMNIRVFIRGLTKYFFFNAIDNPIYSFKKLQLLVYKLMIKFKMIYSFIPEKTLSKININFQALNENPEFLKSAEALKKNEERDDVSEYDDEGEYAREIYPNESRFKGTLKSIIQQNSSSSVSVFYPGAGEVISSD